MCGIVGYIGDKEAQPILLDCLERLEYRGYDSCGIAISDGQIYVYKDAVRVHALKKESPRIKGELGIGHTRWATHGKPCQINAHPHLDCQGKVAVVHNGIISNYQALREQLTSEGHNLISETDTEVIPHLIEKYYTGNLEEAVGAALHDVHGSYAIIAMTVDEADLVVARKDSPLIIGIGDRENFVASDVPAILEYTNRVIYLEDDDIGILSPEGIRIQTRDGRKVSREEHKILWTVEDAQKGGYEHYMIKEIHEQPKVVRDTCAEYTSEDKEIPDLIVPTTNYLEDLLIIASGTSYHAGLLGKYIIEELVGIPVRVELASEFNYAKSPPKSRAIAITQSGETADIIKAIKKLKQSGCWVIAITNVVGSSTSRIADQVICTRAGPEISVAATKSFIAQLIALYWLAIPYYQTDTRRLDKLITGLRQLPN